ncbi:MAG: efflux RND transporter permease subunit [Eggerthellaceae bacterium]|jgi:predicted RND superfamily exporter protein
MHKFGRAVVRLRVPILIIGVILLIPSILGYAATRVNYDLLDYLPDSMDTVKGQEILKDEFGKGAFTMIVTEGMSDADVAALTEDIKNVDHVVDAISYADVTKGSIPVEAVPEDVRKNLVNGDDSLIAVFFDSGTSSDETMNAVSEIRGLADKQVFVSGMSAMVTDLKNIAEADEPVYVAFAVLLALIVLFLFTNSWIAPILFLVSIGMAIMYNMGSNFFLGETSYITKALAAVLQLAVTLDYSIFLWNSYSENRAKYPGDNNEAMGVAIGDTLIAISSSGATAIAGFLALCFMTYTLGMDLGIVMAKGCLLGLIASVTLLPSLLLVFDNIVQKTHHRTLMPHGEKLANFVTKRHAALVAVFIIVAIPAVIGFVNKPVYYDFTNMATGDNSKLSEDEIPYHTANVKLEEDFGVSTTEMILCKSDLGHADAKEMLNRISDVDGVVYAIGYDSIAGGTVPSEAFPSKLSSSFKNGDYQLILINSKYQPSTDEVNNQIDQINSILKEYDENGMLIGEAPATKDLIKTTDHDFMVVDAIAIIAILLILFIVFRSFSIPFILVLVIEFAIMINLGLPYYLNTPMAFLSPICISTIQLGSTVNYAILMTTRYKRERTKGVAKLESIRDAVNYSMPAIITSALTFFIATFGVAEIAGLEIVSQLCGLISRGAIVSMFSVLFILPALLMVFDKIIIKSSRGFEKARENEKNAKAAVKEVHA